MSVLPVNVPYTFFIILNIVQLLCLVVSTVSISTDIDFQLSMSGNLICSNVQLSCSIIVNIFLKEPDKHVSQPQVDLQSVLGHICLINYKYISKDILQTVSGFTRVALAKNNVETAKIGVC